MLFEAPESDWAGGDAGDEGDVVVVEVVNDCGALSGGAHDRPRASSTPPKPATCCGSRPACTRTATATCASTTARAAAATTHATAFIHPWKSSLAVMV